MDQLPKPFFVLAPMDDVTDTVFRQMVGTVASPDLFFTEFVNVDGLISPGRANLLKKLRFVEAEDKLVAQLWGLKPDNFRLVAEQIADGSLARELGLPDGCNFIGVDINMGCPAKSEVRNGACAALIKRENWPLAHEIIEATQQGLAGRLPLSVKTRVGFSTVDMDWFDFLLGHNLDMLTIHGRTRKQMSKVPANWDLIGQVREKRDFLGCKTLIVGNGDVISRQQGEELAQKYKLDGIMIGRGIFHDPNIFAKTTTPNNFNGSYPLKLLVGERVDLYRKHVELFAKTWKDGERPIHTLNKFCKMYIQGFDGASSLRAALMIASSADEIIELLDNHMQSEAFDRNNNLAYHRSGMSNTIKAIVFDSDGTLIDTRQMILLGYKTVLKKHKLAHLATDHYIRQRLGKPVPETYEQILAGHHLEISVQELSDEHDRVQNMMTDLIKPYPHTVESLRQWRKMNVKICLFTSGKRMMIERNFAAAGMDNVDELFDAIVTADDDVARKPEPDAITHLLKQVGVSSQNAVVVGDHAYDIIAGKRAKVGLKVGILHGFGTSHELLGAGADFLCDNIESLNHLMHFAAD